MTDRVKGLVVTFDRDIRVDDIEAIVNAISMIKGVAGVEPSIADTSDQMARMRVRSELLDKFFKFIKEELQS
jgi:hypothetical protein